MGHAVFIQNPKSIYADRPGEVYHFPKMYLAQVRATIGDWAIFYESRKNGGAYGYVAVQKVLDVVPDRARDDHFFAVMDVQSSWEFERVVPRLNGQGTTFESMLRGPDGVPYRGGANTLAVRALPPRDFAAIVDYGLAAVEDVAGMVRRPDRVAQIPAGFADDSAVFEGAPLVGDRLSALVSRPLRDASFARQVKRAYGNRFAMSGLSLTNGGGRPEVEAAHIRPVAHGGPDVVRNGLALSGTLHWMFDRGLLGVAEDHSILISHNKVPRDVVERLIVPHGQLFVPDNPRHRPHEAYLKYHREHIFGQMG
jgi:putative restriction endonuclease